MPDANKKPRTQVELSREGDTATLTLTTASGINILSPATLDDLGGHIERLHSETGIRFVLIRGAGKVFAAGADIAAMRTFDEKQGDAYSKAGHAVFEAIEQLPQVTIAVIGGAALGGGCELAMACDFRLALTSAKLGQPECRLGLIPGWGGTIRLPRLVGQARARWLLFTGDAVSGEEAKHIGLVDEVFASAEELNAGMKQFVERLKPASPAAIARIKTAMLDGDEIRQFGQCFGTSDAKEGMNAFLEKRAASWAS